MSLKTNQRILVKLTNSTRNSEKNDVFVCISPILSSPYVRKSPSLYVRNTGLKVLKGTLSRNAGERKWMTGYCLQSSTNSTQRTVEGRRVNLYTRLNLLLRNILQIITWLRPHTLRAILVIHKYLHIFKNCFT